MPRLALTLGVCCLYLPIVAAAQATVVVRMKATPTEAAMDESIELQIRAEVTGGRIGEVSLPDLNDFEIIARQVSTPFQFSFSTGAGATVQSTKIYTFRLRPLREGTFKLDPVEVSVDSEVFRSNPVTIRVSGKGAAAAPTPTPEPSEVPEKSFDPHAFLQTVVEPQDPYLGQQTTVSVELYTRLQIAGRSVVPKKPDTDGFWIHEFPPTEFRPRQVLVGGTPYQVYTLYRFAAFPQRVGKLEIGSPEVTFDTGGFGFFDPTQRIERRGVATEVDVKPLPLTTLSNVAVGSYEIRTSLDRGQVRTGDAVTLRATVVGTGNLQNLTFDPLKIDGVRALDPNVELRVEAPGGRIEGRKTFEWILVPERPGQFTVPALTFPFFDPSTGQYGTASSEALSFVAAGNPVTTPLQSPLIAPQRGAAPDTAFGPVRTGSRLDRANVPLRSRPWFESALLAPPLLFICLILLTTLKRRLRKHKSRSMRGVVSGTLNRANKHKKKGDAASFYGDIAQTILESLRLRLDEPVTGLTHPQLRELLVGKGTPDDLTDRIIDELEGCDFARFSSAGTSDAEMERCLGRTHALVERIDRLQSAEARA